MRLHVVLGSGCREFRWEPNEHKRHFHMSFAIFQFSFVRTIKRRDAETQRRKETFKTFVTFSVISWIVVVAVLEDTIHETTRISTKRLLSLIHISEPTRLLSISYAVFC